MRFEQMLTAVLLVAALAACDDDAGVQEPGAGLTTDESEDVAAAMADQVSADMDAEFAAVAPSGSAGPALAPSDTVVIEQTYARTRPCPRGGSVAVEGTAIVDVDRTNGLVVIDNQATRTHDDCVLPLRRRDRSIELNGAPNVALSAHFERELNPPAGSQSASIVGAVDWQILDSDRAGTCEIELAIAWQRDAEGGQRTVDGVVCGNEIHVETTWTIDGQVET